MIRKIILILILFSVKFVKSQSYEFKAGFYDRKDSHVYYIINLSKDTINGVSIHCTWFFMKDYMIFWPEDPLVLLGLNRSSGTFPASNGMTFRRRGFHRMSFDFDILPGDTQVFATAINLNPDEKDTVMCTNIQLWFIDKSGEAQNYKVKPNPDPNGDCLYETFFLRGNTGEDGIKVGGPANSTLHESKNCTTGLFAVVIDRNTLQPTLVPGIQSNCPESQPFYFFDPTQSNFKSQFIDLINALPSGDHIFISTMGRKGINLTDTSIRKALEKIGATPNSKSELPFLKASVVFVGYGTKDAPSGYFFCYNPGEPPSGTAETVQKEYLLFPNSYHDPANNFAPCYEEFISPIDKEQPKINNGIESFKKLHFYPNPVKCGEFIHVPTAVKEVELYTLSGTKINTLISQEQKVEIPESLSSGIYLIKSANQQSLLIVHP